MRDIDEELAATGLGLAGVGHGESANVVGNLLLGLANLVGDATVVGASNGLSVAGLERGVGRGASSAGTG